MFSTKHIIIMIISLILIVGLFFPIRKIPLKKLTKIMFIVGIISEVIKCFFYIINNESKFGGYLPKTDLPLQLCSIQVIFFTILCFSKKEKFKRFLYSFMFPTCLLGGIAAIVIPVYSSLNFWVITFQYFTYHIAIILFALKLISSDEFKIELKDYVNCLLGLVCMMFFAIYANSIIFAPDNQVNFMYVVRPPQKGLPFLTDRYGWLVYISHYSLLVLTIATLCYLKPIIKSIKNKLKKENSEK